MLFKKIISSGSPGAESAALDVALRLGIPCGGFDAQGLLIDGNRLIQRYKPIGKAFPNRPSDHHANLDHSDGTLVFTFGALTGYLDYLHVYALRHKKPFLHIDFNATTEKNASLRINLWVAEHVPASLHVAGMSLDEDSRIYQAVFDTMYQTLALGRGASPGTDKGSARPNTVPKTLEEAVAMLVEEMPIRDRVRIAGMTPSQVAMLNIGLGRHIRNRFGLWAGNKALMTSCARAAGLETIHEDQASAIIIQKFAATLSKSHRIRVAACPKIA
jgi:hypothetical protein